MAKKKKSALPKRIAGVKVPKAIRKSGVAELLAKPASRALIAEAIMAASAVGAAAKAKDSSKVHNLVDYAADRLKDTDGKAPDAKEASAALAYAVGEAARTFVDALKHRDGAGQEPRSWTNEMASDEHSRSDDSPEPAPSKKKSRSDRVQPL